MSIGGTMPYIVELEPGCWLAPWKGDPGRTLVIHSAKVFATERAARLAMAKAKSIWGRSFLAAKVVSVRIELHPQA